MTAERMIMLASQAGQGETIINNALALYALAGLFAILCAIIVTFVGYLICCFLYDIINKIKNVNKK